MNVELEDSAFSPAERAAGENTTGEALNSNICPYRQALRQIEGCLSHKIKATVREGVQILL